MLNMESRLVSGRGRRFNDRNINKKPKDFHVIRSGGEMSRSVEVVDVRDPERPSSQQHYHSRYENRHESRKRTLKDQKRLSEKPHDDGFKRRRRDTTEQRQTNKSMQRSWIDDNTSRGQDTSEKTNRSTSPVSKLNASIRGRNKAHRAFDREHYRDCSTSIGKSKRGLMGKLNHGSRPKIDFESQDWKYPDENHEVSNYQTIPYNTNMHSKGNRTQEYTGGNDGFEGGDGRRFTEDGSRLTRDGRGFTESGRGFTEDGRGFTGDGRGLRENGGGFPENGRGFTEDGRGFTGDDRRYTENGRVFPENGRVFPENGRGFPENGRGFPEDGRGFPGDGRGFPENGRGFPEDGRGFPENGRGFPGDGRGFTGDGRGFTGDGRRFMGDGGKFTKEHDMGFTEDREPSGIPGRELTEENDLRFSLDGIGFTGVERGFTGDGRGFTRDGWGLTVNGTEDSMTFAGNSKEFAGKGMGINRVFQGDDCRGSTKQNRFPTVCNPREIRDELYLEKCPITEKEDLASIILRTICDVFDGTTDLKRLQQRLASDGVIRFGSTRSLHKFLNEYKHVFHLEDLEIGEDTEEGELEESHVEDTIMVAGEPKLQLCITHSTKAGSCTEGCRSLHICKYFILSHCEVEERTGKKCLFGHDKNTEHNKNVMRRALIHLIPDEILLKLKYRNSTTVPVICDFYNKERGCNKTACTFLHICRNHVLGRCKSGHCNLTHDIKNHQAYGLLQRYGMAPEDCTQEQEVIEILGKIQSGTTTDTKFPSSTKRPSSKERKEATTAGRVEDSTLDPDLMENIADSSPWDWGWDWRAEDGNWITVGDNLKFEEQFREYIQAQKMTFLINNKPSEINFATMTGRINGESPLKFRRVKREKFNKEEKN